MHKGAKDFVQLVQNLIKKNTDSAREGDHSCFEFLYLQRPLALNVRGKNGRSILNTLVFHGHIKILDFLSGCEENLKCQLKMSNVQFDAARCRNNGPDVIRKMSKFDFSIENWLENDSVGCSSLHIAAEVRGLLKALKYFLKCEKFSRILPYFH